MVHAPTPKELVTQGICPAAHYLMPPKNYVLALEARRIVISYKYTYLKFFIGIGRRDKWIVRAQTELDRAPKEIFNGEPKRALAVCGITVRKEKL